MADLQGGDALVKALFGAGGTTLGIVLTALGTAIKGAISGTTGQEKEIRGALHTENQRLSKDLTDCRNENDDLRQDVRVLDRTSMHYLRGREEARARVNALEQQLGLTQTPWPPDPPESMSHD